MRRITKQEAREALCRYHNLDGSQKFSGIEGVRNVMKQIGSIQYDPLCVVARNADLVLQARVRDYSPKYLEELLYKQRELVDGGDKELCIYQMRDFGKFEKVREPQTEAYINTLRWRGQMGALDIEDEVLKFVRQNGTTGAKDISIGEVRESSWGPKKLSSACIEYLFCQGKLCVVQKKGTLKYYDLAERVVPEEYHCTNDFKEFEDFIDWYVLYRMKAVGLIWNKKGGAWQGHFISEDEIRSAAIKRLVEKNLVVEYQVDGIKEKVYGPKEVEECFANHTESNYARFIAPLDNIMWDRNFVEALYDFYYRWEVYTPVEKRKYGYYVLPVLYNGKMVARFEPYRLKDAKEFKIKQWWWEDSCTVTDDMIETIGREMECFAKMLQTMNAKGNIELLY